MKTPETFEEAKQLSLAKWDEALQQTQDTWVDWWHSTGDNYNTCGFCMYKNAYTYYCEVGSYTCPLFNESSNFCAEEWRAINDLYDEIYWYHERKNNKTNFRTFLRLARKLRNRIANLEEPESEQ